MTLDEKKAIEIEREKSRPEIVIRDINKKIDENDALYHLVTAKLMPITKSGMIDTPEESRPIPVDGSPIVKELERLFDRVVHSGICLSNLESMIDL